jgi:hypothetical protein
VDDGVVIVVTGASLPTVMVTVSVSVPLRPSFTVSDAV